MLLAASGAFRHHLQRITLLPQAPVMSSAGRDAGGRPVYFALHWHFLLPW